jgi:molybdate transport system substrate-binding protein
MGSRLLRLICVLLLYSGMLFSPLAHAEQELIVSAAASLTNAFKEIGAGFERAHPNTKVLFNFSASGQLIQQIEAGAPVDVFASADQETMGLGEAKKLIVLVTRRNFASNRVVLIKPKESTLPFTGLADLTKAEVKRIAVGKPEVVPAGRYAREILQANNLWDILQPKYIYSDTVRQVLDYVARGEVDAGFVYATDAVIAQDKVTAVAEFGTGTPVRYPIALVASGKHVALAQGFIDYVLASEAQAVLAKYGFGRP